MMDKGFKVNPTGTNRVLNLFSASLRAHDVEDSTVANILDGGSFLAARVQHKDESLSLKAINQWVTRCASMAEEDSFELRKQLVGATELVELETLLNDAVIPFLLDNGCLIP